MHRPRLTLLLLALLALVTPALVACGASTPVAIVNDEEIGQADLDERIQQARAFYETQGLTFQDEATLEELREYTLNEMIDERLLLQRGREQGIDPDHQDVQAQFEELVAGYGGDEALDAQLDAQGLSREDITTVLVAQAVLQRNVAERLETQDPPSEDEVRDAYGRVVEGLGGAVPAYQEARGYILEQLEAAQREELAVQFMEDLRTEANIVLQP